MRQLVAVVSDLVSGGAFDLDRVAGLDGVAVILPEHVAVGDGHLSPLQVGHPKSYETPRLCLSEVRRDLIRTSTGARVLHATRLIEKQKPGRSGREFGRRPTDITRNPVRTDALDGSLNHTSKRRRDAPSSRGLASVFHRERQRAKLAPWTSSS